MIFLYFSGVCVVCVVCVCMYVYVCMCVCDFEIIFNNFFLNLIHS